MTVLRRLDAALEPTKQAVLDMKASLDKAGITNQDQALRQAAGQAFYNTSKFTLRDLKARSIRLACTHGLFAGGALAWGGTRTAASVLVYERFFRQEPAPYFASAEDAAAVLAGLPEEEAVV